MKMLSYELGIASDDAYERLVAELVFSDGSVAVVSQERDTDNFEIGFYSPQRDNAVLTDGPAVVDLEIFLGAIAEAKTRLQLLDIPPAPTH